MTERTENVAMSIGTSELDFDKLFAVRSTIGDQLKYVCMDIANGYSNHFAEHVRKVREAFPNIVIIAGNVVTGEMTEELILAGADGGCTCPGDVAKAFAAGADFVMLGGMLAGHDEGGGQVITKIYETGEVVKLGDGFYDSVYKEKQFVQFYGMSSDTANTKHFGGLKDYRSSEGREVLVPYRGEVARTIQDLLGGIRSTCTYAGAIKLKQLSKCTTFIRVNNQYNKTYEATTTKM
jgi:GMP reductase